MEGVLEELMVWCCLVVIFGWFSWWGVIKGKKYVMGFDFRWFENGGFDLIDEGGYLVSYFIFKFVYRRMVWN